MSISSILSVRLISRQNCMSETKVASDGNIYSRTSASSNGRYLNNSNSNERARGNPASEFEGKLEVGAKRRTVACRCVSVTWSLCSGPDRNGEMQAEKKKEKQRDVRRFDARSCSRRCSSSVIVSVSVLNLFSYHLLIRTLETGTCNASYCEHVEWKGSIELTPFQMGQFNSIFDQLEARTVQRLLERIVSDVRGSTLCRGKLSGMLILAWNSYLKVIEIDEACSFVHNYQGTSA